MENFYRLYLETSSAGYLTNMTGCMKPCKYKKYRLMGEPQRLLGHARHFLLRSFGDDKMVSKLGRLTFLPSMYQVETEQLIYPLESLVAEFGGCLGLFLGFSFMTIWDCAMSLKNIKSFCTFDNI